VTAAPTTIAEQLRRDEGCELYVYTCPSGALTIGVGRNLEATGITDEEAEILLANDIERVTIDLERVLPWSLKLDDARLGVLQNMAFNLGTAGLLEFEHMLSAMQREDWDAAAEALLDSHYADQVGARADRLAKQLELGVWQ
jgi:lysozyme